MGYQFKMALAAAASAFAFAAAPANAALVLGSTPCALGDISPTANACRGWYEGNLNSGNAGDKADSAAALNALLGVNTYTGPTLTWKENLGSLSGDTVNFATKLFGDTVVSFHVGAAKGQDDGVGYQGTAFFRFDAGSLGLDTFQFNRAGLSNARLYYTGNGGEGGGGGGVPEPATWGMMMLGIGLMGGVMRRRQRQTVRYSFA
jgi:hypothetical protein